MLLWLHGIFSVKNKQFNNLCLFGEAVLESNVWVREVTLNFQVPTANGMHQLDLTEGAFVCIQQQHRGQAEARHVYLIKPLNNLNNSVI